MLGHTHIGFSVDLGWAGLTAARAKGHLPGGKRIMTESKIASAKKLLAGGTPQPTSPRTSASRSPRSTAGFQPTNNDVHPTREERIQLSVYPLSPLVVSLRDDGIEAAGLTAGAQVGSDTAPPFRGRGFGGPEVGGACHPRLLDGPEPGQANPVEPEGTKINLGTSVMSLSGCSVLILFGAYHDQEYRRLDLRQSVELPPVGTGDAFHRFAEHFGQETRFVGGL